MFKWLQKLTPKKLGMIGLGLTLGGAAVGVFGKLIDGRTQELAIQQAVEDYMKEHPNG